MCLSEEPKLYIQEEDTENGKFYVVYFGRFKLFWSTSRNACKEFILKHDKNIRKGKSMNIYINNKKGK